ncbi:hypothetical protein ACH4F6_30765 [Streptomyces sp. NPDC017936]|uniref:hypothetical protein n=1 Tax=Streptomyces sp. NPDC017936 TaxID=3365016 RepID=UPI0037935696
MRLYLGTPVVLPALPIAASDVAAMTRDRVLPTHRKPVRRPQLHGCGQLVIAIALCRQAVFGLMADDLDVRRRCSPIAAGPFGTEPDFAEAFEAVRQAAHGMVFLLRPGEAAQRCGQAPGVIAGGTGAVARHVPRVTGVPPS